MDNVKIIPIKDFSDGDASHLPKADWKLVNPPSLYLEKVGTSWMEKQNLNKPGVRYYLDKLPVGYRLYERPRPSNSKIHDRHLYGHPKHKWFDSPNRFWPHFEHLMIHCTNENCPCTVCNSKGSAMPGPIARPAGRPSKTVKLVGRPPQVHVPQAVDDETVPDSIRQLLNKLQRDGRIDQAIEERFSMDWRAEHNHVTQSLEQLSKQKSWLPRVGEVVLFLRHLPAESEVCLDNASQEYKIWSATGQFGSHPAWEAGIVGQVPEEAIKLQDVIQETSKTQAVTVSGYRIEPIAHPNSEDKSVSKQYKYVPLHHIRPFAFWKEYLKGIPKANQHPTIANAMTAMSTIAIINRFRMKGVWPTATIYCRGVYLGSELIHVGDTIRLLPSNGGVVEDILEVDAIKLSLSNLDKASNDDNDEGHPYNSRLHIVGKGFTRDLSRSWVRQHDESTSSPPANPSIEGYDDWHWLHDPTKYLQVSFTRVLGRCFEAEPMLLWFPSASSTTSASEELGQLLNFGLDGVQQARKYASDHDNRMLEGKSWYWADSRAEALDISSLNNVDISYYDTMRTEEQLDDWNHAARLMERTAAVAQREASKEDKLEQKNASAKAALTGMKRGRRAVATTALGGSMTPVAEEPTSSEDSMEVNNVAQEAQVQEARRAPTASLKRPLSAATTPDELDQDDVNLDEWVKPVASITLPSGRSPGPPLSLQSPARAIPSSAKSSLEVQLPVAGSHSTANGHRHLSDDGSSSNSDSADGRGGDALAAFKRPKLLVLG